MRGRRKKSQGRKMRTKNLKKTLPESVVQIYFYNFFTKTPG